MNPDQNPSTTASSLPPRPPLPPFDEITAPAKVRAAEDAWNTLVGAPRKMLVGTLADLR